MSLHDRYPAICACIDDSIIATGTVRESALTELVELVADRDAALERIAELVFVLETVRRVHDELNKRCSAEEPRRNGDDADLP